MNEPTNKMNEPTNKMLVDTTQQGRRWDTANQKKVEVRCSKCMTYYIQFESDTVLNCLTCNQVPTIFKIISNT